jgi:hypothetical protein
VTDPIRIPTDPKAPQVCDNCESYCETSTGRTFLLKFSDSPGHFCSVACKDKWKGKHSNDA